MNDLLWPHFQPLWRDLAAASSTNILLADGYSRYPTGPRQLVRLIRRLLTRTHLPILK